ncbi:MAG: class A beta-lactamase [Marinobacter sp.]|nr:class A beta-lactamase [Marinobacter sp.]
MITLRALALLLMTFTFSLTHASPLLEVVKAVEQRLDARVGVTLYDSATGETWDYQGDARFPMTSTFKTLACAALLARVDGGTEDLNRRITFKKDDLVIYSPVTETRTGEPGMTLGEICEATMATSDNTAANLVLNAIGGPDSVTGFVRALGDKITRLDRTETTLNEAAPGDPRDTTTPNAMVNNLRKLVLSDTLANDSRNKLISWLKGNRVSDNLLRSVLPRDWQIGDRSGAGGYGSRSIAAVLWPPNREPLVLAIYITETEASFDERNKAIAEIGRVVVKRY